VPNFLSGNIGTQMFHAYSVKDFFVGVKRSLAIPGKIFIKEANGIL
jgi:hypothetical protein